MLGDLHWSSEPLCEQAFIRRQTAAFTLIELLVVISIVAILIAVLLPAIGKARDVAKSAVCMSRQRSIVQMVNYYFNDNKSYFPASQDGTNNLDQFWHTKLAKHYLSLEPYDAGHAYIGNGKGPELVFRCPAGPDLPAAVPVEVANMTYGWNYLALKHLDFSDLSSGSQTARLSQIQIPSETIVTGDSGNFLAYVIKPYNSYGWINDSYAPVNRHVDKANYSMVDGHVETLSQQQAGDQSMPYWPMRKW